MDAHQMGVLFGRDRSVIVKHIHNVYATRELSRSLTCAKNAQVAADGKVRRMDIYNLDMILSVGYRVNSKQGTRFRQWATEVLRTHLLKGYTVNARRLKELNQAVKLIADMTERRDFAGDEAKAVLRVVSDYGLALTLLDDYDHQRVSVRNVTAGKVRPIGYEDLSRLVESLRKTFGGAELFGREKDNGLKSVLGAVFQTFQGKDVYPSLEEKAAALLYLLVKSHPFVDGNKRIAATAFLWFLENNGRLYRRDGAKRVADNALVAMTLLIASSLPAEKDVLMRVVVNLIDGRNR
ncbi:MAG: type II toxin-antitoxin system death-on-curing family toxin [Elusimicrobia bacterium]|nr:type II toxin-antitoxin system death-on-curing family toxin [Elusimicrobiota bacterium]